MRTGHRSPSNCLGREKTAALGTSWPDLPAASPPNTVGGYGWGISLKNTQQHTSLLVTARTRQRAQTGSSLKDPGFEGPVAGLAGTSPRAQHSQAMRKALATTALICNTVLVKAGGPKRRIRWQWRHCHRVRRGGPPSLTESTNTASILSITTSNYPCQKQSISFTNSGLGGGDDARFMARSDI